MEIKNANELQKGTELYNSAKKGDIFISLDNNEVRKDDDILVNEFLSMGGNTMDYINSYIAKNFDDEFYIGLITK